MSLITLSKWDLKRISTEVSDQLQSLVEQPPKAQRGPSGFVNRLGRESPA